MRPAGSLPPRARPVGVRYVSVATGERTRRARALALAPAWIPLYLHPDGEAPGVVRQGRLTAVVGAVDAACNPVPCLGRNSAGWCEVSRTQFSRRVFFGWLVPCPAYAR
jgi:hypothetical protein